MTKKTKVTIDRAKWRCGGEFGEFMNGKGQTKLLNCEGYMCCLGFITAAANPELNILEKAEPNELNTTVWGLTYPYGPACWKNTKLTREAMEINDSERLGLQSREEQLLKLFEDSPYELEFVGDYESEL